MLIASSGFKLIELVQSALGLISVLQLTHYLWPPEAIVEDGAIFDFIIIGAGTAGSIIGNRLSENENINVLLIEAGDNPPFESDLPGLPLMMKRTSYDWNYTAENDGYNDVCHRQPYFELTLGKMLGGTSSLNYMIYHKGQPADFDSWADISGDETWKWSNVLPYFKKTSKLEDPQLLSSPDKEFYGTDGYVGINRDKRDLINPVLDAFKELGNELNLDFNERHPLGYATQTVTISGKARNGPASAFLASAKSRENLKVMRNTLVTKIIFGADKKARAVEVETKDGKTMTINAQKEIILSGGTLNSPKLLMLSGVGPADHLKSKGIHVISDLPVGENLQEHVSVIIIHSLQKMTEPIHPTPYELPGASFTGFVALDKSKNYPDYQVITFLGTAKLMLLYCTFAFRFADEICDAMFKIDDITLQAFNEILNIRPKSRGKVMLQTTNPHDPPHVNNGFFSNKEDVENLIDYVQDFQAVMNTSYYRSVNAKMVDAYPKCNEYEQGSREYWKCYIMCVSSGLSHLTSTCPIGTVLDGRLKVHGVNGLRVADASVMPTITAGNPYASVMMIGEKVADFIKEEHHLS